MTQVLPFKQGATLSLIGTVLLPAGVWSATCKVKTHDGEPVETLDVDLQPLAEPTATATHSVLIESPSTDTGDWAPGRLDCDVRFVDTSDPPLVVPSDTFVLKVAKRITDA